MAKAVITNVANTRLSSLYAKDYPKTKITNVKDFTAKINDVLPFRVKFINIGIESYTSDFPPPIGLAVIGVNNYIL